MFGHFPDDDLDHHVDGVFVDSDEPIPRDFNFSVGNDSDDETEGLPNELEMEMNILEVDTDDDDDDQHHVNEGKVFDGPLPDASVDARALAQARAEAMNIHRPSKCSGSINVRARMRWHTLESYRRTSFVFIGRTLRCGLELR